MLLASAFSKLKLKYMLAHEVMILELTMLDVIQNLIFKNEGESQIFLLCSFARKKKRSSKAKFNF